jgi:hypothetical protein
MRLTAAERLVLDLVVEDSYALSEVVSRLRDAHRELGVSDVKQLARATVHGLLEAGLVGIATLETPGAGESEIASDAAHAALADDLNWLELKRWRPHVRVFATTAGQEAYRDGL